MPAKIDRRTFFLVPFSGAAAVLRSAAIGDVRFCRVADRMWWRRARWLGADACIIEIDRASEGATFLGSRATLAVDEHGWKIFH